MEDTICAISTAQGNAGIGIIRMSGNDCFNVLDKIFRLKDLTHLSIDNIKGYTMKYGFIVDDYNNKIDEVLVSFFVNPKSYTRENMVEINSHGGSVVEQIILERCLSNGARIAEPGEFTKRAFLNGRIDLAQAEGIIDIINSKTKMEEKASVNQLEGYLSEKIHEVEKDLLNIMADIEASIDYPEYDEVDITSNNIINSLNIVDDKLNVLVKSFDSGRVIKEGIKTVIIGKPNVGKSSLLNKILKTDRAIVSSIEGTTRDTIEEFITINGIPVNIIDTAGIRKTRNEIEKIGVEKAINISNDAELILAIFDISSEISDDDFKILDLIKDKKAIVIFNKVDLKSQSEDELLKRVNEIDKPYVKISAKTGEGIDELYGLVEKLFNLNDFEDGRNIIITNIRHKNEIERALNNINKARESLDNNMTVDIVAINIKEALNSLANITGENVSEDIINEIFSKFCLGK